MTHFSSYTPRALDKQHLSCLLQGFQSLVDNPVGFAAIAADSTEVVEDVILSCFGLRSLRKLQLCESLRVGRCTCPTVFPHQPFFSSGTPYSCLK